MPTNPYKEVKSNSAVDVLNAIRNSATQNYQNYVPVATPDANSIKSIGTIIMDFPELQNEFLHSIVNRLAKVIVTNKSYTNPFKMFKKGVIDFGETIEEIFVNMCKVQDYDADADGTVFKREIPDVRTAFYVMNFQKQYPATINQQQLRTAFLSWNGINDLVSKIVTAMYTAMEYDELQVMKYMIARQALNGLLKTQEIPSITKENLNDIVAVMRQTSNDLEFLSPKYNLAGVMNNSLKENQYIIVSTAFDAKMSVEVLAVAFNMDKAELLAGKRVLIDGFGNTDDTRLGQLFANDPNYKALTSEEKTALNAIPAIVVDQDYFQIYDNLIQMDEIYNPKSMYWNYFLQTWKTFAVSPFACQTLFIAGVPTVTSVKVTPTAVTMNPSQQLQFNATVATTNFASKAVIWSITGEVSDSTIITPQGMIRIGSDETSKSITVTATSVFDNTKTGTATVTLP